MRILLIVALVLPAIVLGAESQLLDRPVRYVERSMITLHDVQERLLIQLRAQKRQLPKDRKVLEQLHIEALEELTEEELLLQEADRLGFSLSERLVYAEVRKQLEEAQQIPDPRTLAELVKQRVRIIKIQTVTSHYVDMAPSIRPLDIAKFYDKHSTEFKRPGRWQLFQILMIPSDEAAKKKVFESLLAVYRNIQDSSVQEIKALVDEEVSKKFLQMTFGGDEQITFLQSLCAKLLALEIQDAGPLTTRLMANAKSASTSVDQLYDKAAIQQKLSAIREELLALADGKARLNAFKTHANELTMGIGAGVGGSLGIVELERQAPELQERLVKLNDHDVSDVFWSGSAGMLVMVGNFEEPFVRTFNEVNGEIRKKLEKQQRKAVRNDLIKQLKEKASIIDIDFMQ